jgi:hypothetical protein
LEDLVKFQEFIGFNEDVYKYLHNTRNEAIAKTILKEGFDFEGYIDQTADLITGIELIELKYFLIKRGRYGNCTIVIEISKDLVDQYAKRLSDRPFHYSEALTCRDPYIGDNDEPVYRLPNQFIKGFYNHTNHKITFNKHFDPDYKADYFETNIRRMLGLEEK